MKTIEDENLSHEESLTTTDRWLVSYADFITLLFALFVVLYATSNRDQEKTKKLQESIKKYLIKMGSSTGSNGSKVSVNQAPQFDSILESPIKNFNKEKNVRADFFDEVEKVLDESLTPQEREKYIVDQEQEAIGMRIILSSESIYAQNSIKFNKQAVPFIKKLGAIITKLQRKIMIESHAYQMSHISKMTFPSLWEFTSARASNMVRFLIQNKNTSPSLLAPVGLGDSRPIPGSQRQNERIELVVLAEDLLI
ncbi:MAG: hypothetical protein K1X29_05000 [Bdellovibrionales bacterium]|nr:hypothetical protein [Bdellovibrionales bacterium]